MCQNTDTLFFLFKNKKKFAETDNHIELPFSETQFIYKCANKDKIYLVKEQVFSK